MKVRAMVLGLVLAAVTVLAADVDGKWAGAVNTPNGDFPVAFEFMAAGAALNGSMLGMDGMKIPIKDGKVDGSNISFSVTLDFGGMPLTLNYKGVVATSQIKLSGDANGQAFELVVKKSQ